MVVSSLNTPDIAERRDLDKTKESAEIVENPDAMRRGFLCLDFVLRTGGAGARREIVGAGRYGAAEAEAEHEEVHNAPQRHHKYECEDAPECKAACALTSSLVARANDKVPDDIVEEEEKGERKDERYQGGIYEPHDGDEVALDGAWFLGKREAGNQCKSECGEYLFHTPIIPQVRSHSGEVLWRRLTRYFYML